MFPKSIQWRLVFIIIAITFVVITVVWVTLNYQVERIFYDSFSSDISNRYPSLKVDQQTSFENLVNALETNPAINSVIDYPNKRSFSVINVESGEIEIVYSSDSMFTRYPEEFKLQISRSRNLLDVMSGRKEIGDDSSYVQNNEEGFYDYVISQQLKEGKYILFFKYYRGEVEKTIQAFNRVIIYSMALAILAAIVIGYLLARTITVPIVNIMHKAENITTGEFGQLLEVKSKDEIGKLTRTFNYMSTRLKNMLIEISREKSKVETILNYMTDGIIAYDLKGEIVHVNPATIRILGVKDFISSFNEFVNRYDLDITMEQILIPNQKIPIIKNIATPERFIRIQFVSVTDESNHVEAIITVIQDVTEQEKLDIMRREFVANVSHELRTPLTSIKSYSETLLDGAIEDKSTAERFLEVINSETDRMTRLVKDLLTLSKHDSGIRLNQSELNLIDLAANCVERMKMAADEKKQALEFYVIGNPPGIIGDKDRLEQVLINVISNAIKYTPELGKISVYVGTLYDQVYVKVSDTGIGIPGEDLNRIFERFYRVDKARSRQMGGTGLGLSIAKEITEAHGGTISAKSQLDKGTEITIKLPI